MLKKPSSYIKKSIDTVDGCEILWLDDEKSLKIIVGFLPERTGKIHHEKYGNINYFDWAIFNSNLLVITRGYI